jgi:hypothetical protein
LRIHRTGRVRKFCQLGHRSPKALWNRRALGFFFLQKQTDGYTASTGVAPLVYVGEAGGAGIAQIQ